MYNIYVQYLRTSYYHLVAVQCIVISIQINENPSTWLSLSMSNLFYCTDVPELTQSNLARELKGVNQPIELGTYLNIDADFMDKIRRQHHLGRYL